MAERAALAKGELLTASHLWTPEFYQQAQAWLGNFADDEKWLASVLLDGFLYFSDRHATELMAAGFQALSGGIVKTATAPIDAKSAWAAFWDDCVVTWVEGETPHGTDSGPEAARKFRKRTNFPEARIVSPSEALAAVMTNQTSAVVFVDDFMGSGNQIAKTLSRAFGYRLEGKPVDASFDTVITQLADVTVHYCPSVTTADAVERLRLERPWVTVSAGALLDERYGVLHPQSVIWPDAVRAEGQAFVRQVSDRLGLPDTDGAEDDWRGFHKLGLAIAIRDTIPDASLRLFRHDVSWQPLMKVA